MKPQKTLVVLYPGCILWEILPAYNIISQFGPIEIASPDGSSISDETNLGISAHVTYEKAQNSSDSYHAVLIPGGDIEYCATQPETINLLKSLRATNQLKAIGGICSGAIVCGMAGILEQKRCTHTMNPATVDREEFREVFDIIDSSMATSMFVDEDCVIDGNVITAKPNYSIKFGSEIAKILYPNLKEQIETVAASMSK